jgi:hypothetical protein
MSRSFPVLSVNDDLLFMVDPGGAGVYWVRSWPYRGPLRQLLLRTAPEQQAQALANQLLANQLWNPVVLKAALLRLPDGRWCRCRWEQIRGRWQWAGRLVMAARAAELLRDLRPPLPAKLRELLDADCRWEAQKEEGQRRGSAPAEGNANAGDRPPIPTDTQERCLGLLTGKALTADSLQAKLSLDRKCLYRDVLKPLRVAGRIDNCRALGGYYRPDKPPRRARKYLLPKKSPRN